MRFWPLAIISIWPYVHRFGALVFVPLALLDSSVVPTPGSMDALLVVLCAGKREFWWYYVIAATLSSTLGGYVSYRIALKNGKEAIEKKLGKRAEKVYAKFEKWGFGSLVGGAIAPPPVPFGPFVMAAGALQYPLKKFLAAVALGRALRYTAVALITAHYGRHIFHFFSKYYKPAVWTLIVLAVIGGVAGLVYYLRWKKRDRANATPDPAQKAA
jgi:membrane protein YqaA with SNARE-associated domain